MMDRSFPRQDALLAAGLSVTKELRWRSMDAERQTGQGHGAYRLREAPRARGRPEPHRVLDIYQRTHRQWRSFAKLVVEKPWVSDRQEERTDDGNEDWDSSLD